MLDVETHRTGHACTSLRTLTSAAIARHGKPKGHHVKPSAIALHAESGCLQGKGLHAAAGCIADTPRHAPINSPSEECPACGPMHCIEGLLPRGISAVDVSCTRRHTHTSRDGRVEVNALHL